MARPLTQASEAPWALVQLGDRTLPIDAPSPDVVRLPGARHETVEQVAERHGWTRPAVGLHVVDPSADGSAVVVELVLPERTPAAHAEAVLATLDAGEMSTIVCRDVPGRVVDRLLVTAWLESARQGLPADPWLRARDTAQDLDRIRAMLHLGLGAERYAGPGRSLGPSAPDHDSLVLAVVAEAYRMVDDGVAGTDAIERAMTLGAGWPSGPFASAGAMGLRSLVTHLVNEARGATDPITADRFSMPSLVWAMATA